MKNTSDNHKTVATQFIKAFNTNNWDIVRKVVSPNYVYHHPIGGTVQAGPEGMIAAWSSFKSSLPDSWHPIPVMITDQDHLAVLLPTYGNFTGKSYHNIPANGKWVEYGMVNIVRFEEGLIVENWLGMDPLAEMQQMGAAPSMPHRQLTSPEKANMELFQQTINIKSQEFDNLTVFGNVVVALGPPQYKKDTSTRKVEIYHSFNNSLKLVKSNEFITNPPYAGDLSVDTEHSRDIVNRFYKDILKEHNLNSLSKIVSPDILIHPTAMPCEASYYGINGITSWLKTQWKTFSDLAITDYFTVANGDIVATHWQAQGTSKGKFLMLPPSGKTIQFTGASMYRIINNQILRFGRLKTL